MGGLQALAFEISENPLQIACGCLGEIDPKSLYDTSGSTDTGAFFRRSTPRSENHHPQQGDRTEYLCDNQ